MSNLHIVKQTLGPSASALKSLIVYCPTGETALGGGWSSLNGFAMTVAVSGPYGDPPTGWQVIAFLNSGSATWSLDVYAVCGVVATSTSTPSSTITILAMPPN